MYIVLCHRYDNNIHMGKYVPSFRCVRRWQVRIWHGNTVNALSGPGVFRAETRTARTRAHFCRNGTRRRFEKRTIGGVYHCNGRWENILWSVLLNRSYRSIQRGRRRTIIICYERNNTGHARIAIDDGRLPVGGVLQAGGTWHDIREIRG